MDLALDVAESPVLEQGGGDEETVICRLLHEAHHGGGAGGLGRQHRQARVVEAHRDLAATHAEGLGTAASWRALLRTYAQLTTSVVVFCNRVGVDESISFWGGSEVIGPAGETIARAPLYDEAVVYADVPLADVRRERIALPLLRDERPVLQVRELERIVAERAGLAPDATGDGEPGS